MEKWRIKQKIKISTRLDSGGQIFSDPESRGKRPEF